MTTDELQKVIDSNLKIVGSGGKFRITVDREEMIWDSKNTSFLQMEEEKMRENLESSD
jgi:predicted Rdx family selenoprotein